MSDDILSQADDPLHEPSTAMLPAGAAEQRIAEWSGPAAFSQPPAAMGGDLSVFLHAFRRHWLLSLGIGLVCAVAAGAGVYFGVEQKYSATAYLTINMQETRILGGTVNLTDRDRFEIFKATQKEKLLSRMVLMAALRQPDIKNIPLIQQESNIGDPVDWLKNHLSITFPGKAEVMAVEISRPDKNEAAAIVNAVIDSYWKNVVEDELKQRRERLSKLETTCAEIETQIRSNRGELRSLVGSRGGGGDAETMTQAIKNLIEELSVCRNELLRRQLETGDLESQLGGQKALLKNVDSSPVPDEEVDALVQADPIGRQVSQEMQIKKMDEVYYEETVKKDAKSRYAQKHSGEYKRLLEQYEEKRKEITAKIRQRKHLMVENEVVRLQTALEVRKEQMAQLSRKVDQLTDKVSGVGQSSVDIEMLRSQLKQSVATLSQLNSEREKLRIELQSAPRISTPEKAEPPVLPSNQKSRLAMVVMAILAGMGFPAIIIAVLDVRVHRINTADDVSKGLNVPVIGSVPLIPARVIRQLGAPSKRYNTWQIRLTESVDGITARLLRKADVEQSRVIMVSSATGGEGKTTLATQLAMSLARTGRTVVLVDFDLRRPAFDEVFGVPLQPGVCDLLRRQNTIADLVHPTNTDNLSVIAAGRWDRQALASLSNGCAKSMFGQLRDAYDFVVIDTSPLLPVADARFVSQHVDTVVLSVLRDVSQAPKIQAACDILAAFGVPSVEAVVTGSGGSMYGRRNEYESTISA